MSFYDVSFMVSGMLVQQWPSFCPCRLPDGITPSRPGRLDSCQQLIPGLTERDLTNMPRACGRSFALRSLNLSGPSPSPTLWVEDGGESLGSPLLSRLCTPDCGVSRLILAGRKQGSTAQRAVLNCLAQRDCPVRHLVFFDCYYSEEEAANLAKEFQNFQVPLSSLAFVSTPLHINSLVDILRSASKISDLLIHSPKNLSGKNFDKVVRPLRENAHLQRLSLTSCGLDESEMRSLADFLMSSHCFVTALNLRTNPLPRVGVECLYKALKGSQAPKPLQMLSLCGSENDKSVAEATLNFLESPRCGLQVLDLSGRVTCTDFKWIQRLCQILGQQEHCQQLQKLYIFARSGISSKDIKSDSSLLMIQALKGPNCEISSISFSWPDPQCQKEAEDAIMSRQNGKRAVWTPTPPSRNAHESLTHDDIYISQAAEASSSGDVMRREMAALKNRTSDLERESDNRKEEIDGLRREVAAINNRVSDLERVQAYTRQLLENFIPNGENALPFLPLFLMVEKKDLQEPPFNMKTGTLYLLCESHKGFHPVANQKGLKLQNVKTPKWLARLIPVLVPALKLLVFTGLVILSIHVAHGLVSAGITAPLFKLLNACNTHNYDPDKWSHNMKKRALCNSVDDLQKKVDQMDSGPPPDPASLQEFYAKLLGGSKAAKELDMAKTFNLYRASFPDHKNDLWVCKQCLQRCPGATEKPTKNPFSDLRLPK